MSYKNKQKKTNWQKKMFYIYDVKNYVSILKKTSQT